jgi:hypothetical protein
MKIGKEKTKSKEEKHMKKILSVCFAAIFLIVSLCVLVQPALAVTSGTCGENLTWTLDENGVLTIAGTGPMADYSYGDMPSWNSYRGQIQKVVMEDGITTIGSMAFYNHTALSEVEFPGTLTKIGESSFDSCYELKEVQLPYGLEVIEAYAFESCTSMTSLKIGSGMKTLGDAAFGSCNSLKEIYFTGNAPVFGIEVFSGVTATVYYPENDETWTEEVRQNYGGTIIWTAEAPFTVGDANGDGTVNPLDALMLLQCYVGMLDAEAITLTACDCNGDGTVNPLDALLLLQYYIGMIDKFPVE